MPSGTIAATTGAVAVKSATGFATAAGIWTIIVGGALTILYLVIKVAPRWRELGIEGDARFRKELMSEVSALRRELKVVTALHDAEMSVMRHRLNGETHTLDTLILMLEASPEKTVATIQKIKELRTQQRENIAKEQAALIEARAAAMRELGEPLASAIPEIERKEGA